jgi:hypothetical protein
MITNKKFFHFWKHLNSRHFNPYSQFYICFSLLFYRFYIRIFYICKCTLDFIMSNTVSACLLLLILLPLTKGRFLALFWIKRSIKYTEGIFTAYRHFHSISATPCFETLMSDTRILSLTSVVRMVGFQDIPFLWEGGGSFWCIRTVLMRTRTVSLRFVCM